jgi:hypothetical protein
MFGTGCTGGTNAFPRQSTINLEHDADTDEHDELIESNDDDSAPPAPAEASPALISGPNLLPSPGTPHPVRLRDPSLPESVPAWAQLLLQEVRTLRTDNERLHSRIDMLIEQQRMFHTALRGESENGPEVVESAASE